MGYHDRMKFLTFMNTPTGREIRIGGGLLLVGIGLVLGGGFGLGLALFAVLPITTGIFGVCPINPLFGRSVRACARPVERTTVTR